MLGRLSGNLQGRLSGSSSRQYLRMFPREMLKKSWPEPANQCKYVGNVELNASSRRHVMGYLKPSIACPDPRELL
jgi:hypothetical protein